MKPANKWIQFGRILGITLIVVVAGGAIYFWSMVFPWIEGSDGALVIALVLLFLAALLGIFLYIAWRREILGGIFYLLLGIIPALFYLSLPVEKMLGADVSLIPAIATGVLFLIGGLQKKKVAANE